MDTKDTAFTVLADPQRRAILDILRTGEVPVSELVARLAVNQPTVSKHLKVLRDAGLVAVRRDAQRRWYRLAPDSLAEVDAWLAPYRHFWNERLDLLDRHLTTMSDDADTRKDDAP